MLNDKKPASSKELIKRIFKEYVVNYLRTIIFSVGLMVVAALMTAAMAKLMEPIIDGVFTAKDSNLLWPVAISVFSAFVLRGFATYGHSVLMSKTAQAIIADIQRDVLDNLIKADIAYFHKNTSGSLISKLISDVTVMRGTFADTLTSFGKSFLTLTFLLIVMFYQDWKLTLISLFVFPAAAFFVAKIGKRLRKVSKNTQEEMGSFLNQLNQVFQGIRSVKAYGMESFEISKTRTNIKNLYELTYKSLQVSALSTPLSEILSGLAIVTIIVYGGYQVIEGTSTPGKLFSFITAFLLAYEPMKKLAKLNNTLQIGLAASERVFDLLDMKPTIINKKDAVELKIRKPSINFKNVTFTYDDGTVALNDISMKVPSGKTVALVGPSGAGKSTILNLIPRFYDITSGKISINKFDINDVTFESLRENMALVSQEITIFNDTVTNNIKYGSLDATEEEIMQAVKSAKADEFIEKLPDGYNTILGEHGVKLSGGQRQRIAIARAMLRNAPILLLDEATSALDTDSERAVQNALDKLQKGRTTIVVAHRLSTIMNSDIIYVIDKGQIVEEGTHKDLLAIKDGLYKRLYSHMIE